MKKYLFLSLALFFTLTAFSKSKASTHSNAPVGVVQDSLTAYTGKYQKDFNGKMFYLQIALENGELVGTQLWDNQKMGLKHLSGDNFIVSGIDWSVKFIRNESGKITQVLVMGTDYWTKLKD